MLSPHRSGSLGTIAGRLAEHRAEIAALQKQVSQERLASQDRIADGFDPKTLNDGFWQRLERRP